MRFLVTVYQNHLMSRRLVDAFIGTPEECESFSEKHLYDGNTVCMEPIMKQPYPVMATNSAQQNPLPKESEDLIMQQAEKPRQFGGSVQVTVPDEAASAHDTQHPSIHVLLTTVGRDALPRMLNSLVDQLLPSDHLTVVSDDKHEFVRECLDKTPFKCVVTHYANEATLGFWGHPSRTKYQNQLQGDYIMNADDDDRYVPGCFAVIREKLKEKKLYIFRHENKGNFAWHTAGKVEIGNIGTSCGVIPNTGSLPEWENFYGGDGRFYEKLSQLIPFEFVDFVIYKVGDTL